MRAPDADGSRPLTILFELFKASQLSRTLVRTAMGRDGLRSDDYAVYSLLRVAGPLPPAELAAGLGMAATTISGYVRRIAARGHIEARPNPDDGRSYLVALTPAGDDAFLAAQERFLDGRRAFEAGLTRPQAEMFAALEELQAALREGQRTLRRSARRRGHSASDSPIRTSSSHDAQR